MQKQNPIAKQPVSEQTTMTRRETEMTSPDDVTMAVPGLAGEDKPPAVQQGQHQTAGLDVQGPRVQVGKVPRPVQLLGELAARGCTHRQMVFLVIVGGC